MTILAVCNDDKMLKHYAKQLRQAFGGAVIVSQPDPLMAGRYSFFHPVDLLVANLKMRRMDGVDMGRFVRRTNPGARVYLITVPEELERYGTPGDEEVDGLLFRPVTEETFHSLLDMECATII